MWKASFRISYIRNRPIVCTSIRVYTLYSRPNLYALVKSCINVNHYLLLVRRHLKCVVYKILRWGEKWPLPWDIQNKRLPASGGEPPWPPTRLIPQTPVRSPAPNLPLHYCLLSVCLSVCRQHWCWISWKLSEVFYKKCPRCVDWWHHRWRHVTMTSNSWRHNLQSRRFSKLGLDQLSVWIL